MPPTLVERARTALLEAILANKANLARNEVATSVKLLAEAYMLLGDASILTPPATPETAHVAAPVVEVQNAPVA